MVFMKHCGLQQADTMVVYVWVNGRSKQLRTYDGHSLERV
jgi:hypothetical protein